MRKVIRFLLGLIACGVLVYAGVNLADYIRESNKSIALKEALIEDAVVTRNPAAEPTETPEAVETPEASFAVNQIGEQDTQQTVHPAAPIQVDFDVLAETNGDIVGWLYSEDTPINLPVVQSGDNDAYLRRMVDGTWNSSGTLFVDYRNASDFSDNNTIIYGHNMKNDEMFGTLPNYKDQSYYDAHPVMWLMTPNGDYQIELVAGYVTETSSEVYNFEQSEDAVFATVQQVIENSTFTSNVTVHRGDRFLTLSTCSYEYENARYVLIGRLTPLE